MHPKEARKQKCGTGRLCHLVLKNSRLHVGVDFTHDSKVRALIDDPEYQSVLLFPTPQAVNLSQDGYRTVVANKQKLQIFVVDGTWPLARKLLRLSGNLRALPTVSFTPQKPSSFQFKKQPRAECLSTLESIHLLLELGQQQGVEAADRNIDQLPAIFERLVQIQVKCATPNTNYQVQGAPRSLGRNNCS